MSDWQERITQDSPPAVRAEHELRYRLAAPLIGASAIWADLGCGSGVAPRAALGPARPPQAVLVDVDEDLVAAAARELAMPEAIRLAGDLTDRATLDRIEEALLGTKGERTVTCFEVVEHLATFVPFIEWASRLAREEAATFLISVPNDAFWSIENPYHATRWGEGAFEELVGLLPGPRTLLHQLALAGSAVVGADAPAASFELALEVAGTGRVPTHFLAAFGPRHGELSPSALAAAADLPAQRRWERQRESNLALAETTIEELKARLAEQDAQYDAWRTYIHELERELGRPLSGTTGDGGSAA